MFDSQSKAHVLHNCIQLTSLKNGALSIAGYFQKARSLAQALATIGEPIKDSELLSYILGRLGLEYESIVTSISTYIERILLDDLYSHLLTHEQRLEHAHNPNDFSISMMNVAQRNSSNNGRFQPQKSGSSFGHDRGRGRGCGFSPFFSNHHICQICNRIGHITSKCYNRFDHSYHCDSTPSATYLTFHQSPFDSNWYPDTGSTNHITNDLSNLNLRANEYKGTNQIKVGNGQGLDILHIGLA
jgi:hypothetical protein